MSDMIQSQLTLPKVSYTVEWKKLPDDFHLPDEPVENIYHPLLASALREILELAGFITSSMLFDWIATMGLYLGVWYGTKAEITCYWLRWWDESGTLLPWGVERVEQSLQEGVQQGIMQEKLAMINRLLIRRIGGITPDVQSRINGLFATALDELSEALLDFTDMTDLVNWIEQY
ncbi:DUF4351 domain-containing protein [Coleofasciculus chthonoplastes]|uniref:DUF4351 domain-containing protein n=1 Tax=Coleofasciculus chthonoplastes TaxID=64178 RepID=UPI0032F8A239